MGKGRSGPLTDGAVHGPGVLGGRELHAEPEAARTQEVDAAHENDHAGADVQADRLVAVETDDVQRGQDEPPEHVEGVRGDGETEGKLLQGVVTFRAHMALSRSIGTNVALLELE